MRPRSRPVALAVAASLLPVLGLAGCAERWVRPGASEAQAEATNEVCGARAHRAHPPILQQRLVSPARIETDRTCRHRNGREECRTETRHVPEQWTTVDLAEGARREWRFACMADHGFAFAGYRPLRLFGEASDVPAPTATVSAPSVPGVPAAGGAAKGPAVIAPDADGGT